MKRFLLCVSLFSAIILALAVTGEIMLRRIPTAYTFKNGLVNREKSRVRHLIIGSSVANAGIDPALLPAGSINMALSGEWMRFNEAVFFKYANDMPQLQDVIWGLCYHALWADDTPEFDRRSVACHRIYMGIGRIDGHPIVSNSELIALGSLAMRKWSTFYLKGKPTVFCDSLGLDHGYDLSEKKAPWRKEIPMISEMHTKYFLRDKEGRLYRENVERLHRVAAWCQAHGRPLYIVMPPVHPEYFALMNRRQLSLIRSAVSEVARRWSCVRYLEYFSDTRFEDDDFYDGNHLTSDRGAQKFTRILRHDLYGQAAGADRPQ